jgi:hypothetical protein
MITLTMIFLIAPFKLRPGTSRSIVMQDEKNMWLLTSGGGSTQDSYVWIFR